MRRFLIWFFVCIFLISYADVAAFYLMPTISESGGFISPYFCHVDDCEAVLMHYLSLAQEDISCAFFDLDLDSVYALLDEKSAAGVSVRLVVDNVNYGLYKPYLIIDTSKQYMHHKFCVIDHRYVLTGSLNPTAAGVHKNAENLVVFLSPTLARDFLFEFAELWSGQYGGGRYTPFPSVLVNGSRVDVFFCPEDSCEDVVARELSQAKSSIHFLAFSFTSERLAEILFTKNTTIPVVGVLDARQVDSPIVALSTFYSGPGVLHHKVFIVDNSTVLFGSYNPTYRGNALNDEVLLVVRDADFAAYFMREYSRSTPIHSKNLKGTGGLSGQSNK